MSLHRSFHPERYHFSFHQPTNVISRVQQQVMPYLSTVSQKNTSWDCWCRNFCCRPDALLVNQPIAWLIVNKVIQSITPSNSYEAARIAMGCSLTSSSCTSCSLAASLITSRLSWRVLSATCSFNFSTVSRNSSRPTAECNPHHSKCLVIQSKYSWTHVQVFNVSFSHWKPTETGH